MSDSENQLKNTDNGTTEEPLFKKPSDVKVIFYNDDFTSMDFVTEVLVSIFNKSVKEAEELMLKVHNEGSSLIGTYTYDIAVSRTNLTRTIARNNGFPLKVEIE